jgi:hypothetical protein
MLVESFLPTSSPHTPKHDFNYPCSLVLPTSDFIITTHSCIKFEYLNIFITVLIQHISSVNMLLCHRNMLEQL